MKTIRITHEEIKTQKDAIKWHLKNYGHITTWEAITEYGYTRLADVIHKLRKQGYTIHSEDVQKITRFNMKTTITRYLYFKPKPQYEQKLIWG